MVTGRNEPCPCGSGRKFKHCCGGVKAATTQLPTRADRDAAWQLLDRVSCLPRFRDDVALAHALVWDEYDDDELDEMLDTPAGSLFFEWLWLDHVLHTKQTIAEYALANHAKDLGPGGRRFLQGCIDAPLRVLQIDRVEPGVRVYVRDLIDRGPVIPVTERLGSEQLVKHEILIARMARYDDDTLFEGVNLRIAVDDKRYLMRSIKSMRRPLEHELPDGNERGKVLRMATGAAILRNVALMFERPAPHLTTSDGEDLVLANAVFSVSNPSAVQASLATVADLERDDTAIDKALAHYTWFETAAPPQAKGRKTTRRNASQVLGGVILTDSQLRIETLSLSRARRAQEYFTALLPADAARFKGIRTQGVQSMLRQAMGNDDDVPDRTASSDLPAEEVAAIERDFMEQHYRDWLDIPVPALGDRTPREAAAIKHLRPRLRDLVEGIEIQAARSAKDGRGFDVAHLRRELKLK